jgi:3-hydroxy-5-methyl-1-naphthoate 3-O-methyltransferase
VERVDDRCRGVRAMLVNTDAGDTYSFEEIASWLKDVGFVNPRTIASPGPSPLIVANKP